MVQEQNLKDNKNNRCLYGFEKRQVSLALAKAWTDYFNLSKEQVYDRKRVLRYERVIHKLQDELGIPLTMFNIFKMLALAFYMYNPELFKEDVT